MTSDVEATFGFVDLAGFTALTEFHGDQTAVALLDRFEALVASAVGPQDRLVKMIGDAAMVAFAGPAAAVAATRRLYEAVVVEPDFPIPRSGLHHGSAIARGDDYIGAAVNLAARVAAQAHGGQVLVTAAVAAAARDLGVGVDDLGAFALRNVAESVELFDLQVATLDEVVTIDPVCRMQVHHDNAAGRLSHREHMYWFCSLACAAQFAANPEAYAT